MATASAGSYASLHLTPDRQPRQHPTTQFFTGRMPFLPPNQQRQSTEGRPRVIIDSLLASPKTAQVRIYLTYRKISLNRNCTPRKCKHAVDCYIRLISNYFTKRHATRLIYRQTVQTLSDGLETQFTPPDTTLSCRVWRAV